MERIKFGTASAKYVLFALLAGTVAVGHVACDDDAGNFSSKAGSGGDAGAGGSDGGAGGEAGSGGDGGAGGSAELPPLRIGLVVHLEGWALSDQAGFDFYAAGIREYAQLANDYGAVFSWETRNLIGASQTYGDNVLLDLRDSYGQGVGVHADVGGNPATTLSQFQTVLDDAHVGMVGLSISPLSVSGICSHLPWVQVAANSGYRSVSGVVRYCLKALPEAEQPDDVKACASPADCHQPYPSTTEERIHPWRASQAATFTGHTADGDIVIMPSFGSIVCLKENQDSEGSHTGCTFDEEDVATGVALVGEAMGMREEGKVNQLHFVWSYGSAVDKDLLAQLLSGIDAHVQAGNATWQSLDDTVDEYLALPADQQEP